jgi:hypothetical protein
LIPTADAELPNISPPMDHRPRSIKKKLSTLPSRRGGVADCKAIFTQDRKAIKQNPTETSNAKEKTK